MFNFRLLRGADFSLWVCAGILLMFGFFAIFSATGSNDPASGGAFKFIIRHFWSLAAAITFMLFCAYLNYKHWASINWLLYGIMLVLLAMVLVKGFAAMGAQRWLTLGFISFQPSEISKLFLIVALAALLKDKIGKLDDLRSLIWPGVVFLVPFLLVFKQPDLGTALVMLAITFCLLLYAGLSWEQLALLFTPVISVILCQFFWLWLIYIVLLFLVLTFFRMSWFNLILTMLLNVGVGLAFPFVWDLLKEYQKQRIYTFFNPAADPLGAGYHTMQSEIAVGSGMLMGRGFLQGTQTQLHFIPIQYADFIFSVIGEEFGLLGGLTVLGVFLVMIWRMIYIAVSAPDTFGQLLGIGIAGMFIFHVTVNIGMTLGLLPIVGIPLPLLSYGGSAMFLNLGCIGVMQSIAMRREKLIF